MKSKLSAEDLRDLTDMSHELIRLGNRLLHFVDKTPTSKKVDQYVIECQIDEVWGAYNLDTKVTSLFKGLDFLKKATGKIERNFLANKPIKAWRLVAIYETRDEKVLKTVMRRKQSKKPSMVGTSAMNKEGLT
jgi:hypothetical protein